MWTTEEEDVLRRLYPKLQKGNSEKIWAKILKSLPGRSKYACQVRANRLRLVVKRPWTAQEDAIIRRRWAEGAATTMLRYLPGRTRLAIQYRAKRLGLEGRWQGYVSVREAAEITGFSHDGLISVLDTMQVAVQLKGVTKKNRVQRYPHRVVELEAAEEAVKNYLKLERPYQAAARWKLNQDLVCRWVREAKLRDPNARHALRLPPEDYDRIINERLKTWKPRMKIS